MIASLESRPVFVLSQRGPLAFGADTSGTLSACPAGGGLASAFGTLSKKRPFRWIAAAVSPQDRLAAHAPRSWQTGLTQVSLVDLPPAVSRLHYARFSNPLLWLLQHDLPDRLIAPRSPGEIEQAWEGGYRPANEAMAHHLVQMARGEDRPVVLVQDYHLYLAPALIRRALPDALIAHFVHIPWPDPQAWALLPPHIVEEILGGLAQAALIGFQTAGDADRFLATCREYPGSMCRRTFGEWEALVRHYPIAVDAVELRASAGSAETARLRRSVRRNEAELIVGRVDRLDPSKNVPRGFEAFGLMLARNPSLRGRVRFVAHLVPSRSEIPEYDAERTDAFAAADRVNRAFGSGEWRPIEIHYEENRALALAIMSESDVCLVNSVADGMNLVAKEMAVLNSRDGALVLSRRAGAWDELGPWALGVNPMDVPATALALERALSMLPEERRHRADGLRRAVEASSLDHWLDQQLADLYSAGRGAPGWSVGRQRGSRPAA